ncbi:MAG: ADOP family duplicated permease, partial [Acidobacteriota bacterium]
VDTARYAPRLTRWMEDAWRDVHHGFRLLRRAPLFTATAALSLAIGIGANTAIFTVANALLLRPPTGIADPGSLVDIGSARGDGGLNPLSYRTYLEVTRRTASLSSVFAQDMFPHVMGLSTAVADVADPVVGRSVTSDFFRTLESPPSRGRTFLDSDDAAAVLDYDYWKRHFDGDDRVVGQTMRINGRGVVIVGVAAPGFQGTGIQRSDVWLTFGRTRLDGPVLAGGRVRPGISTDTALAEVRTIGETLNHERGAGAQVPRLNGLPFSRVGGNKKIVAGLTGLLMGLVSLVLLAACANIGGIQMTRSTARTREMALRTALGANRARLVRQLLTETAILFALGGMLGLGLAFALMRLATMVLPALPARVDLDLTLDWHVLAFAVCLSLGASFVFGILPALKSAKADAAAALKDGTRSSSSRTRLRSAFVIGQIACSVLLIVLATLFVRALRQGGAADPGFDPQGVDMALIDVSVMGPRTDDTSPFWPTMIEHVRQQPTVEAASLARVPPGGWEGIGLGSVAAGDAMNAGDVFSPGWNIVDTDYFATLRIPIVGGRDFSTNDRTGTPSVVVISKALAQRLWPGQSVIGKPLRLTMFNARAQRDEVRLSTIVGVAGDIRSSSLIDGLAQPYVYLPLRQTDVVDSLQMTGQMSIVARRRGPASLAPVMATVAQDIDPRLVLSRTETLAEAVALGLMPQRVLATLSGVMGLVALLLASMGIYGVTAYSVALRRREFSIRLALGASRTRVVQMVFRQTTMLVTVGLAIGLAIGGGVGQALSVIFAAFFYGLSAVDWPAILGTVMLFGGLGVAASVIPASRAVRAGWSRALQEE